MSTKKITVLNSQKNQSFEIITTAETWGAFCSEISSKVVGLGNLKGVAKLLSGRATLEDDQDIMPEEDEYKVYLFVKNTKAGQENPKTTLLRIIKKTEEVYNKAGIDTSDCYFEELENELTN
jgi:hypothetical protein